jgi:hypothetical protein
MGTNDVACKVRMDEKLESNQNGRARH